MGIGVGTAIAGGALLSAGVSYFGAKDAKKSNKKTARKQMDFEREKWAEYLVDLESRREAVVNERRERELLADRKYSTAMQDWKLKSGAIDEMIGMWETYEEDPTSVPAWRAFNEAIMGEAKKSIKGLSGQMERAGRTGGSQDRMRQDVGEKLMSRLGNEMLNIQEQARGKQLELEGGRPAQPFLEYFGDPELGGGLPQYGGSLPGGVETFIPPDLSGFGMMAAQLLGNKGGGDTTVNVGSTQPTGGFYGGWEDYSKNTKPLNYLSPRDKILGVG
jgi:hypothetical protein